jgi:putative sensory transduction regulator
MSEPARGPRTISLFDEMAAFLAGDGWSTIAAELEGFPVLETVFSGGEATWRCVARIFEPYGQIAFESILPFTAAPEARSEVAELIARMNWKLLTGSFAIDMDTGEIHFRTSVLLADGEPLTPRIAKGLVYSNVLTVERCYEELSSAVRDGSPAAEAFARLGL